MEDESIYMGRQSTICGIKDLNFNMGDSLRLILGPVPRSKLVIEDREVSFYVSGI